MHAYHASVSDDPPPVPAPEAVLIVGVNWLGDSIMTMPAIQAYQRAHPETRLVMLVKPKLTSLWAIHRAIQQVWSLPDTLAGMGQVVKKAASYRFHASFILPHSFRSTLVPFLARVPERTGLSGHGRDWMLTRVVRPTVTPGREHQCFEYMALMGASETHPEAPSLMISDALSKYALRQLAPLPFPRVALMPGAVFGPAKRWPPEHFAAVGRMLKGAMRCGIVVMGSSSEHEGGERIVREIGPGSLNLAGQTSLPECAAILSRCALVITNDSGGMHLAAAVGTSVLAIFGITDPKKTGPLGNRSQVLQDSALRSRDIPRNSKAAALSLRRIHPEQVFDTACRMLARSGRHP